MRKRGFLIFICAMFAFVTVLWGIGQGWAKNDNEPKYRGGKLTTAERKAAAKRLKDLGLLPGIAGVTASAVPDPGGVPHYFGPYANWAFSPLPRGAAVVTITDPGTGYRVYQSSGHHRRCLRPEWCTDIVFVYSNASSCSGPRCG